MGGAVRRLRWAVGDGGGRGRAWVRVGARVCVCVGVCVRLPTLTDHPKMGFAFEHEGHCTLPWEGVPPVQNPGGSLLPSQDFLSLFEKKEGHLPTRGRTVYFQAFGLGGVANLTPGVV